MEKARYSLPAVALLCTLPLSGCASSSPEGGTFAPSDAPTAGLPSAPASTTPVAPSMSRAQADDNVLERYRAYQRAYEKAYATGDPEPLAEVATEPLLGIITKDVNATFKDRKGVIWRFRNVLNPKVHSRSKDLSSILVVDCVRTLGAYKFSAKTGKRIGGTDKSSTYVYQARFQYDGTTWKAAEARKGKRC
ncbi:hypothetical protein [Actinocorallia populi]|uniref:hypothetical protein n=1 Tax=Actinocorallia populi TaxID=2079200 RepID=UPI000D08C90B|nr:hypothetical protein [Actinocorallia populi]